MRLSLTREVTLRTTSRRTRTVRATAVVACLVTAGYLVLSGQLPASAASAVSVNAGTTYQSIDGFGVSEAFGQANSIRNLGGTARKQALDLLFSTANGAGFSILRSLIPSGSDSIEPTSPGGPTATPKYVWDGSNDATDQGQLWLAKQAKTYGVTNFYNNAWSAPGYMKTNGSESNGGSLCGTPGASCGSGDWRQAYANYLVQHAKFWSSAGLTPSAVGFVNEPTLTTSYSSMLVTNSQAADFLSVFGRTMRASGLPTRVSCCEALGFNQLPGYVNAVTSNADVGLLTSHGYSGAPTTPVANTGGRPVWESEWSINGNTWTNVWDSTGEASGITWAQRIHNAMTGANLNAFLYWWGISATSHDSSLIGLSGSTLTPSKRYYALANYSRFIRPGAVRIAATGADSNLKTSAYRNSDGSVVIVTLNTGTNAIATDYSVSGAGAASGTVTPYLTNGSNSMATQPALPMSAGRFSTTVPARSLVSYVIKGGAVVTTPPTIPTTPSSSPTTSPTTSPPPSGGSGCAATYAITNTWTGGFQADVTVTNNTPAVVNGWTVRWTLPGGQTISQLWNGTLSVDGGNVTVRNVSWNGSLGAGASATFGLIVNGGSPSIAPLVCSSP